MTSSKTDPQRPSGYRGALPERDDTLARPWIITVIAIFVLVFVLSLLEVPSRFIPDPTPVPTPIATATPEPSADGSAEPSEDESADASASASEADASASASSAP